jgi:hypothetical protein
VPGFGEAGALDGAGNWIHGFSFRVFGSLSDSAPRAVLLADAKDKQNAARQAPLPEGEARRPLRHDGQIGFLCPL